MRSARWLVPVLSVSVGFVSLAVHAQGRRRGAAVPTATRTPAAGATVLRYSYVAGERARYVSRQAQHAPTPAGDTRSTSHIEIETVSVGADGVARLRMRMVDLDVQSAAITPDVRQQINRGIGGMALTYSQDARGHVSARGGATGVSAEFQPLVDGLMQSLDQMSPSFPATPVAVGGTWSDHRTLQMNLMPGVALGMELDLSYTLREVRSAPTGQVVVLACTVGMRLNPGTAAGGVSFRGEGQATGDMTLDMAHGQIISTRSQGHMQMHVSVNGRNTDVPSRFENEMVREGAPATP